jgi:trk system potassium uptake protein
MRIVVLVCGRVGARLAERMASAHEVTVIDWRESAFEQLPAHFAGETVVGNGIDVDALKACGVSGADVFFALTEGDNRNLMAAQIARGLGATRAIARVYDPVRCRVFSAMGVETISPTILGAERLFDLVVAPEEEK